MNKILLIISTICPLLGCENSTSTQKGVDIPHASKYKTTVIETKSFNIHSYTNDTIYRNCGYELVIEPHDSSTNFSLEPSNGSLLRHSTDPYRFIVQPSEESFELTVVENDKDSTKLKYVSPNLPSPKLTVETFSDSVALTLTFPDERLKQLLPKDTRYAFRLEEELCKEMTVSGDAFDTITVKPVRLNYRNEIYDIETE